MTVKQRIWTSTAGWNLPPSPSADQASLVFIFGGKQALLDEGLIRSLQAEHPCALLFGSSTAGEIADTRVLDDSLVATSITFRDTVVRSSVVRLDDCADSREAGTRLARNIPAFCEVPGQADPFPLVHVIVLSDGLLVNGSELVRGITQTLPSGVPLTGGLAGDGTAFENTLVRCGSVADSGIIAAIGFYGQHLRIGFGSLGGWDSFGPERLITRSAGNMLYELDGQSALALYKQYLGEHSRNLPATGLLFPLSVRGPFSSRKPVVRTILSVDEKEQSMTFAGDVPEGSYARLMKANFERLIDGAVGAARTSYAASGSEAPDLALLISCVGRKLVLRQRIEDEIEGVRDILGSTCLLAGFYSYGEISPFAPAAPCELHNQTMTITTFREL